VFRPQRRTPDLRVWGVFRSNNKILILYVNLIIKPACCSPQAGGSAGRSHSRAYCLKPTYKSEKESDRFDRDGKIEKKTELKSLSNKKQAIKRRMEKEFEKQGNESI
jgi:hypothetical protein